MVQFFASWCSVHVHMAKMERHLSSLCCHIWKNGQEYYSCRLRHDIVLLQHVLFVTFNPRQYIFITGPVVTEGPYIKCIITRCSC